MVKDNKIIGTCFLGWAGSGKTHLSEILAKRLGILHIRETQNYQHMQDFENPKIQEYFKQKEKVDIVPLEIASIDEVEFITDIHFGRIYNVFNTLLNKKEKVFESMYNELKTTTPNNVAIIGLETSLEQTQANLEARSKQDWEALKHLAPEMSEIMIGFMHYLQEQNLPNYTIIDTTRYNPFNEIAQRSFIKENQLYLPKGGLENEIWT